jgi:hypothetical protein
MKVVGFDGREYSFTPSNKQSAATKRSKLHDEVYAFLREIYPFSNILQEVSLPGSSSGRTRYLVADFFLPAEELIVEAHGEQHYKFNSHFYDSKKDFLLAKTRDKKKREWCENNQIRHVELAYNETEEEWRNKI